MFFYSTQETYAVQVPYLNYITPDGQPYTSYRTEYYSNTILPLSFTRRNFSFLERVCWNWSYALSFRQQEQTKGNIIG